MFSRIALPTRPYWFWGFLALLVLLPLPFGGNRPWASDLSGVICGVLLIAMLWTREGAPPRPGTPPRKRLVFCMAGITLLIFWMFVQTVSWTPDAWHHPLWSEAAALLGSIRGAISVDPGAFPEALVRFLSAVAVFILAFQSGRDRDDAKMILHALAYAGFAYALYGLIVQSTGSETILWYKKWAYQGFLTSTFVNKNSYAAYAGLGLLCSLYVVRERFKRVTAKDLALAKKSRLAALFVSLSAWDFAVLFMPVVILGALALTGSRAGAASALLGVFTLFLAFAIARRWSAKKWFILAGTIGVVFVLFVNMGGDALMTRLQDEKLGEDQSTRLAAYALVRQAISDNPVFGFGLGTFDGAFRLYRDASLPLWFHHAHNDYLEMMMDLGVPAALLLFVCLAVPASCCVVGVWKRKRDAMIPAIAVAATVLIGSHVLVDFSLHIPAIAATYAALLGVGVAQSFSSQTKIQELSRLQQSKAAPRRKDQETPCSQQTGASQKK